MALVALVAREAGEGAYLFSAMRLVHQGSSLSVPQIPLCISIGTTKDTLRYIYNYL